MCVFCVLHSYKRLDIALQILLDSKRNQVSQLIESKRVLVNNKVAKKSQALKKGDEIRIDFSKNMQEDSITQGLLPLDSKCFGMDGTLNLGGKNIANFKEDSKNALENLNIEIIAQTPDFVIFNKPQNLVIHAAPSVKEITLCDYLKSRNFTLSNLAGQERLGIVHRLDKDTSGAILVAKNNKSHAHFSELLKQRKMGRIYLCVISPPLRENVIIEKFLGRNPHNRLKMAVLDKDRFPQARDSKSEFRKIMRSDNGKFELVSVRLFSGRTHQIRVHLDSINRHIYGDSLYSPATLAKGYKCKMLLHATLLYFNTLPNFIESKGVLDSKDSILEAKDIIDSKDSIESRECKNGEDSINIMECKNSGGEVFFAPLPRDFTAFLESNFTNYKEVLNAHLDEWKNELKVSII
ncbi:RluA family pseudouridine synthase [Helicobacter saguini]|uniref:RNA pseudouridylate synthase n=1 Tax=Helicobacter saguini TaxID=1548018 RepID=A0A347W6D0_9HELI|nr:RluA family pseudouridine synthase [Helicobacter saguini]MWV61058.1 RluA family pseudouridine synthase [Helicobacter saguini]MWV68273.1 RluA family pseudouridine synthase [Helicobacter saguini]MWV70262.1 RluA family pseudouridine synthase [Helicobacter saguini]MWV72165.1 RluA family pseudouridine synthase [Helicobacter saguini]TLD95226.1 RluA family pseudouridine synthase [Helicobacter saguini]